VQAAAESKPLVSLIDPDHASFTAPVSMPEAIREFCRRAGQAAPESEGAVIRCALESLALRYRLVLGWLEELTSSRIETIHIVGGGVNNKLLCQMAADACNRRVVAGPSEATALGNVLVQAIASGQFDSVAQAREVVCNSFELQEYLPQNPSPWDEAFERFRKLLRGPALPSVG
jgi:rhamnulokinase